MRSSCSFNCLKLNERKGSQLFVSRAPSRTERQKSSFLATARVPLPFQDEFYKVYFAASRKRRAAREVQGECWEEPGLWPYSRL